MNYSWKKIATTSSRKKRKKLTQETTVYPLGEVTRKAGLASNDNMDMSAVTPYTMVIDSGFF